MTPEQNKLIESYKEKFEDDLMLVKQVEDKITGANVHYTETNIHRAYLYEESKLWDRLHENDTLEEFEIELKKQLLRSYKAKMIAKLFLITNKARNVYEYVMSKPDEMFLECKYDFEKFKQLNKILEYNENSREKK
jgi:hypothetical protein